MQAHHHGVQGGLHGRTKKTLKTKGRPGGIFHASRRRWRHPNIISTFLFPLPDRAARYPIIYPVAFQYRFFHLSFITSIPILEKCIESFFFIKDVKKEGCPRPPCSGKRAKDRGGKRGMCTRGRVLISCFRGRRLDSINRVTGIVRGSRFGLPLPVQENTVPHRGYLF